MSKEITLAHLLKEKFIELELKSNNKKKLLGELVELLAQSGKITDTKAFMSALLKREKLGSTGIGNGVAIPHAKSDIVNDFIIAFGRHTPGVDFGALDGEKTYLFFILASPITDVGAHLKIMAEISRLVKDKFIVESLKKAENKKEIIKIIAISGK